MVETYLRERKTLCAVVVILDIRREPTDGDLNLLTWLKSYGIRPIIVLTKIDKISRSKRASRISAISKGLAGLAEQKPVLFSAHTREGIKDVWQRIDKTLDNMELRGA
jgi:GTP-binding protein